MEARRGLLPPLASVSPRSPGSPRLSGDDHGGGNGDALDAGDVAAHAPRMAPGDDDEWYDPSNSAVLRDA